MKTKKIGQLFPKEDLLGPLEQLDSFNHGQQVLLIPLIEIAKCLPKINVSFLYETMSSKDLLNSKVFTVPYESITRRLFILC